MYIWLLVCFPCVLPVDTVIMVRVHQPQPKRPLEKDARISWLRALLVISTVSLVFLLFPSLWWGLLAIIDIRGWTWRSWAVASTIWIVGLVGIKVWRDANGDR